MDRYFHAEVVTASIYDSDARAFELADQYAGAIAAKGGKLTVSRAFGDRPGMLVIVVPEGVDPAGPTGVIPGLAFSEVHVTQVPSVPDNGITE